MICFCELISETKQRRNTRSQKKQVTTGSQNKKQKTFTTYQKQKKNTAKRKSDRNSRESQTDSESDTSLLPIQKNDSHAMQQSDSGLFISPITNRHLGKLPKMNASDTSTPSSAVGGKSLNESCFGFDNIMSPQGLPFSPVNRVSPGDNRRCTPMSDVSSFQSSMGSGTSSILSPPKRKYENVEYSGLIQSERDQSEQPVSKKSKKKKTQVRAI